jgi:hypothetical protein
MRAPPGTVRLGLLADIGFAAVSNLLIVFYFVILFDSFE